MKKLGIFVMVLLFLCSCNSYCPEEATNQAIEQFNSIDNKMVDAYNLAGATARINLSSIVSKMQDIKNELDNLKVPQCLNGTKSSYDQAFMDVINAYLSFMRQQSYQSLIDNSKMEWDEARMELYAIKNCIPNCKK